MPEQVGLYSVEMALSLPWWWAFTNEQLDELFDKLSTQYKDVAVVYAGVCNPHLVIFKFEDMPDEGQIRRVCNQVAALAGHPNDN